MTKLPEAKLAEMAKTMPVFAPGVDPLFKAGAVTTIWDAHKPFAEQLMGTLSGLSGMDGRDVLGKDRGGREVAAEVARRVTAAVGGAR